MARNFIKPNVGAKGRRRIVPMMGIDFIAGQIERKGTPDDKYGKKPASLGGRTRYWSFVNFLHVDSNMGRQTALSAGEITARENFKIAVKSARATSRDISVLSDAQYDFVSGVKYGNEDPSNYATFRGWLSAIRLEQIKNGVTITETTTTWPPVMHS